MSLSFNITGLNATLAKLENVPKETENLVDQEIKAFAISVVNDAKILCPNIEGEDIRNSIQADTSQHLAASANVNSGIAAYIEFGTGPYVFIAPFNFTDDMRNYAKQFYVNGKGATHSMPFLFPAYEKNRIELLERLKAYK